MCITQKNVEDFIASFSGTQGQRSRLPNTTALESSFINVAYFECYKWIPLTGFMILRHKY